jgi:hypothetical protein
MSVLETVRDARQLGLAAIFSDGDAVFQPRKIDRSGLWRALDDNVLIYVHNKKSWRPWGVLLSGQTLFADRRQACHSRRSQEGLEGKGHHGISQARSLRLRRGNPRQFSARRRRDRAHLRLDEIRFASALAFLSGRGPERK